MSTVTFQRLAGEYDRLWDEMEIRDAWLDRCDAAAKKILAHQKRYKAVAAQLGACPWVLVGLIHQLEASGRWDRHLHNGDKLTARTRREPKGHPKAGKPPFTWEASAIDALRIKRVHQIKHWSLARLAYTAERNNGLGYRLHYPHVLSPYLWSGTTYYTRGKYKSDGKFSASLVSQQPGVMAVLQALCQRSPAIRKEFGMPTKTKAPAKRKPAAKPNPKSPILPLYRPKQSDAVTRAVLGRYLHLMPEDRRDDEVRILFVRGYYRDSMGKRGKNDRAIYDDACFVVTPEGVQAFNANSDPSAYRKRIATIKAEQAICYKPGPHGYKRRGGPYPAFRQHEDCTVARDRAGDDHGMHHVNLHKGGVSGTSSLGCLTIPPHQWDEFRSLVTGLLSAHDQETVYVTLLEYAGGEPPVTASEASHMTAPGKMTREDAFSLGFLGALLVAVSGWWDAISTWIGGLI